MAQRDSLWGTLFADTLEWSSRDWIVKMIDLIPSSIAPTHFAGGERKRTGSHWEIENRTSLAAFVSNHSGCYLHGKLARFELSFSSAVASQISMFSHHVERTVPEIIGWIESMDLAGTGLIYGYAAMRSECEHRNAYNYRFADSKNSAVHGWVGRDFRRRVPGLYWLNYLSRNYQAANNLDPGTVARATGSRTIECKNGHIIVLYSSPIDWKERSGLIDQFLESDDRFFSMQQVRIPTHFCRHDSLDLVGYVAERWP